MNMFYNNNNKQICIAPSGRNSFEVTTLWRYTNLFITIIIIIIIEHVR